MEKENIKTQIWVALIAKLGTTGLASIQELNSAADLIFKSIGIQ